MNLQLTRTPVETLLRSCLRFTILIGAISAFLFISGCATQAPVEEVKEVYQTVWPKPPEQARIQYLGELSPIKTAENETSITDVLLG